MMPTARTIHSVSLMRIMAQGDGRINTAGAAVCIFIARFFLRSKYLSINRGLRASQSLCCVLIDVLQHRVSPARD